MKMPGVAETLLRGLIADPDLREAVLGDLEEERSERAASDGPEAAQEWVRHQAWRTAPHLLAAWWRGVDDHELRATLGRAMVVLATVVLLAAGTLVGISAVSHGPPGWPPPWGRHALALAMVLSTAGWALLGGLVIAARSSRGPMAAALVLGLGWIPLTLVPASLFPAPPGPPAWLHLAFPATLVLATTIGGAVATLLGWPDRAAASGTAPSHSEDPMNTERHTARLLVRPVLAAAFLLMVPMAAMQVTDQVAWNPGDFLVMGALVVGAGVLFELALWRTRDSAYRFAVGLGLGAAFLLVWVTGAVGIIGAAGDDADLMYGGVLAVGLVGTLFARFRPRGMAGVMLATAAAQAVVAAIALAVGPGAPATGPVELLGLNGLFVALFVGSAWLFRKAAGRVTPAGSGLEG